jgi:hypothetical protein
MLGGHFDEAPLVAFDAVEVGPEIEVQPLEGKCMAGPRSDLRINGHSYGGLLFALPAEVV